MLPDQENKEVQERAGLTKKEITRYRIWVVAAALFFPVFGGVQHGLRESFCTVAAPSEPSSGPGGYARSQQRVKHPALNCPYNWMK